VGRGEDEQCVLPRLPDSEGHPRIAESNAEDTKRTAVIPHHPHERERQIAPAQLHALAGGQRDGRVGGHCDRSRGRAAQKEEAKDGGLGQQIEKRPQTKPSRNAPQEPPLSAAVARCPQTPPHRPPSRLRYRWCFGPYLPCASRMYFSASRARCLQVR